MKKQTVLNKSNKSMLNKEDLLKLRGGTQTDTTFACKHGVQILGCVTIGTCDLSQAETWCRSNCPDFDTIVYSCGNVVTCSV